MIVGYIAITCIVIIAVIILYSWYFNSRRTKAIRQLAQIMNFAFSEKGNDSVCDILGEFQLFPLVYSKKISNVLTGSFNDVPVMIFDYRYTIGSGKGTKTRKQTMVAMESDRLQLPKFILRPENLSDKIIDMFVHKKIDFKAYPDFSRHYFVSGKEEESVRNIFKDESISYFEANPGLSVKGDGTRLICYRESKLIAPNKIQAFLQQGYDIFAFLKVY